MRCKRCGELLEPTDTQCPVCGKTLTPIRKKTPARKPGEPAMKIPQLDRFVHSYQRDAARSRTLQMVTIAAAVAAVALLVLVYMGMGQLQSSLTGLREVSDALLQAQEQEQPPVQLPEEPTPTVSTEPSSQPGEESLPLSQQQIQAALRLTHTDAALYAAALMDLGSFDDRAVAWVTTDAESRDSSADAVLVLEGSGDLLALALSERYGSGDVSVFAGLNWSLEGDTFSALADPMCIWEYRVTGGEWEALPIEYVTAIAGGCEVRLSPEAVETMLGQAIGAELRCTVSMTHPDGGSMKIVADGILFSAEGPAVGGGVTN